jgi:translation initiation factor 2 subunit 1
VNYEKKQIDLSLRRVPLSVKKKKNDDYKQEQRAEKILELVGQKTKTTLEEIYKEFGKNVIEQYGNINTFFQEYIAEATTLDEAKIPKKYQKILEETIKEKIKPISVKVESILELSSEAPNGIDIIKKALKEAEKTAKEKKYELEITYISSPKYRLVLTTTDYKKGEKEIEEIAEKAIEIITKEGGKGELQEK